MRTTDELLRLLGDARAEAVRLGPVAAGLAQRLDEALAEAAAIAARECVPDEGRRPEELSSANDG